MLPEDVLTAYSLDIWSVRRMWRMMKPDELRNNDVDVLLDLESRFWCLVLALVRFLLRCCWFLGSLALVTM